MSVPMLQWRNNRQDLASPSLLQSRNTNLPRTRKGDIHPQCWIITSWLQDDRARWRWQNERTLIPYILPHIDADDLRKSRRGILANPVILKEYIVSSEVFMTWREAPYSVTGTPEDSETNSQDFKLSLFHGVHQDPSQIQQYLIYGNHLIAETAWTVEFLLWICSAPFLHSLFASVVPLYYYFLVSIAKKIGWLGRAHTGGFRN